MQVKPFVLVGASVLTSIQSRLEQALRCWAQEWGIPSDALTLRAQRAWESAAPSRPIAWSGFAVQKRELHAGWHPASADALQELMFSPDAGPGGQTLDMARLAPAAGHKSRDALAMALVAAALPDAVPAGSGEAPPRALFERGAGAVIVTIHIGGQVSCLVLNRECVGALHNSLAGPALPALAPVQYGHALAATGVSLDLGIGHARVGLGQLMHLAVGDVIRLDTPVERALTLSLPSGTVVLNGYMGRVGDQVAVELTRQN